MTRTSANKTDPMIHDFGYYTARQLAGLLGVDYQRAQRYKRQGQVTWLVTGRWVCGWCGSTDRSRMIRKPSGKCQRSMCRWCLPAYEHHVPWAVYQAWVDRGCGICGYGAGRTAKLCIDHDHACCPGRRSCGECVRGILCDYHNTLVGHLEAKEAVRVAAWLNAR